MAERNRRESRTDSRTDSDWTTQWRQIHFSQIHTLLPACCCSHHKSYLKFPSSLCALPDYGGRSGQQHCQHPLVVPVQKGEPGRRTPLRPHPCGDAREVHLQHQAEAIRPHPLRQLHGVSSHQRWEEGSVIFSLAWHFLELYFYLRFILTQTNTQEMLQYVHIHALSSPDNFTMALLLVTLGFFIY